MGVVREESFPAAVGVDHVVVWWGDIRFDLAHDAGASSKSAFSVLASADVACDSRLRERCVGRARI